MPRTAKLRPAPSTRDAILQAAIQEFAGEGIAGARTDAIARAAGVNKALLYYYFKDKETLYGATLDYVFSGLAARLRVALDAPLPPREKVLAYVTAHFDYVAGEAASGLQLAGLETGVPVAFGVLTVDTAEQAQDRLDKGAEAARAALEMADLFAQVREQAKSG